VKSWLLVPTVALALLGAGAAEATRDDAVQEERAPAAKKSDGAIPTQDWIKRDGDPDKVVTTVQIFILFTVLAVAPSILVLLTSFTRIVIVLSFVRRALALQDLPPNQVIVGLSIILTFLVMTPTINMIKQDAVDPYMTADARGRITQQEALDRAVHHLRGFMEKHTRSEDLHMLMEITKQPPKEGGWTLADVPTTVLVPSFVISELRRAFLMGFALFLPFLVIDLVVASILVSMGMIVLPPMLISLPFKVLLFVLVDGWQLIVGSLVRSFY
jgi:flagellar biosynthetic protein FliP